MLKKKLLLLGIIVASIFTLSSCNLSDFLYRNESSLLSYTLSESEYNTNISNIDYLINSSNDLKDKEELSDLEKYRITLYMQQYINYIYKLTSCRSKEYVSYSLDKSRGTTRYFSIQDKIQTAFLKYKEYLTISKDIPVLRTLMFGDKTDEEISKIIGKDYSDRYYELQNDIDEYETEFNDLSQQDSNYQSNVEEIYIKIINSYKELAKEAGYDSVLEYQYDYFGRDYDEEDADKFADYVAQYIVPTLYENQYTKDTLSSDLTVTEKEKFDSFFKSSDKSSNMTYFDSYMSTFDDNSFKNNYYKFKNTNAFYATTLNSVEGAYTTYLAESKTAICYFGMGYQNIFTKVHEFGHMNAMIYSGKNNIPNPALDISESQSQCNEMLFLAYLVNNENKLGANLTDAIKKYKIRDCFRIILLSTLMDQFEQEVYSNSSNYTKDQLNDVMLDVCENMGGYEKIKQALQGGDPLEYYHRAIVDSQFYYISYATSLIPAVNMYEEGIKDYNNAQNIYKSIYEFDSNNYKFKDGIENAGLNNPFDEEAFIGLTNLLA